MFKIGVMLESFRIDRNDAIKIASKLGADGFQMYSVNGDNTPENLTPDKRRELLDFTKSNGLVFSALCGDLGGGGFSYKEQNAEKVEKSKRILDLAKDLECDIVTTHIGVVPSDPNHDRYKIMQEACFELSRYADNIGSHFAIETGPESPDVLKGFLDSLNSKGVAVNLDPANLKMVLDVDPVYAVHTLKDYIVHTHAKDGEFISQCVPEEIYGLKERKVMEESSPCFREVALGKGQVNFPTYLNALKEIGYEGFLTIERECGENPLGDITDAVNFLKNLI